jgi:hypothetical protein
MWRNARNVPQSPPEPRHLWPHAAGHCETTRHGMRPYGARKGLVPVASGARVTVVATSWMIAGDGGAPRREDHRKP